MLARVRERWSISAETYQRITLVSLIALTLVVLTGAAVRLTGSGLGCPTWPRCTRSSFHPALNSYALIEFTNRVLIFAVSAAAIAAAVGAFLRRPLHPRRRDLELLGILLPLGVVAQAVVGGESVLYKLAPGWVMAHYWLSMLILIAAFALWRRSRMEPDEIGRPGAGRAMILGVRLLSALAAVVVVLGSASTAAGPHAGASGTGQFVHRLSFWGAETLSRMVHLHGYLVTIMGLGTLGLWWLARRSGASHELVRTLALTCLLLAAQGILGITQYTLQLPSELVWLHVSLATLTWVGYVHAWSAAGRLPARSPRSLRAETAAVAGARPRQPADGATSSMS
ncbi:MAG: COX15/CtaA family protein [Solirubrobacteraceae bacterium]